MTAATQKAKFVKYLGKAHINSINIALYDNGTVCAENVVSNKTLGTKKFVDVDDAQGWFDNLGSDNTARTANGIALFQHD